MKKPLKFFIILVAVIVLAFGALTLFIGTMDANRYRPQLVKVLSEKTGRTVKLNGPIEFSLRPSGLRISVQDGSISNPSWASRPLMAGMGKFELGVDILPLFERRLSIHELSIENADILLETSPTGQRNWDLTEAAPAATTAPTEAPTAKAPTASTHRGSLDIENVKITNSQLALRGADKKLTSINIAALALQKSSKGEALSLTGDINGAPITAEIKTSLVDLLSKEPFSFNVLATFNVFRVTAEGTANLKNSTATISTYEVAARKTRLTGSLTANWKGRPSVEGTLKSENVDLADFKSSDDTPEPEGEVAKKTPENPPAAKDADKRLFSDSVLPFDALTAIDATLDIGVGELPIGKAALKQITAKLALTGGNLVLAPLKASLGTAPVDAEVRLNAAQAPARLTAGIITDAIDLAELQKLAAIPSFMTGKTGANIQLTGDGNTPHEIASTLGGVVNVTAENGQILTGAASDISSSLASIFNPGGSANALNCLAARFTVKNGIMASNGILVDSAATTVAANGVINLASETIDMTLHAKTKLVDVGGFVPALKISGSLGSPGYSVDTAGMVKNVVGQLTSGSLSLPSSTVPDIQADPSGKNACIYTLDHPKKPASSNILAPGSNQKIKDIGNKFIKGLLGQ